MKVLVVEDNVSGRLLLFKVLKKEGYQVFSSNNGAEAVELLKKEAFDAVLTDWMMPKLDGIELVQYIRKNIKPVPVVIIITALDSPQAKLKALEAGADDYIAKPFHINEIKKCLESSIMRRKSEFDPSSGIKEAEKNLRPVFPALGIAASTGGPSTLTELFSALRPLDEAAVFIVLHGPVWMLKSFSERLQSFTKMEVRLAEDKMPIKKGTVYVAPGDVHMMIDPSCMEIKLWDGPPENYIRPSADPLFRSMALAFGKNAVAVVLTGMGHDGSIGAGYISASGGRVIAQEPSGAIAPSMPQSVIDLRIAGVVAPLEEIPKIIEESIGSLVKSVKEKPD
ncbi:MAG: chemotaxis protein CheB [Ignavibacteria bacterium]|jgi:two-component system chemotaxis response regulator CheB|nr:chemotaxis protein CheB [Ignavibacteria bacterium]MCU7502695.1 chemotaxis protein CheB [Ignavibacteria bacterium]MCU7517376.1 chemotaxis protein CheB [Ignavibacteria bacterium]